MSGKAGTKTAPETPATEKVDGRKGRKMSEAQKAAMAEARTRNARIRGNIAEAVEQCPDALTKPSVWSGLDAATAEKVVAAIQKVQGERKQARIDALKAELATLEGSEG